MGSLQSRRRGGVPIGLVLVIAVVAVVGAAAVWLPWGDLTGIALVVTIAVLALVWTVAWRVRRHDEVSADRQRKVRHDESWTSGRQEE